ncbi:cytochrome P450 302a1, mitochondrial [Coccinella septempunctata]|uniref:cytochrome P450 302a1, mitochondrial n=1 Tax=Coccinella septempunctata TaxID=41139 RepID=UPI001D090B71|nr:cytochrome P450 302a1, mitochondrial [Coccinella septempunctata]
MCFKKKVLRILEPSSNQCRVFSTEIRKPFNSIPGPLSLPAIGTLYQYLPLIGRYKFSKLHINGLKKYKQFGSIVREEIVPGVNTVWLFDPNDIEHLFRNEGVHPKRRSHLALQKYRLDKPHVYNTGGLLPTNGENWWKLRQVFQKGLSGPIAVKNFISGSNEIVDEFLDRLNLMSKCSNIDYLPELSRLYLELICLSVFDVRMDSFSESELSRNSRSTKLLKSALITNDCILKLDNGPQLWRHFTTPLYWKLKKAQTCMEDVAIDMVGIKMHTYQELNYDQPRSLLDIYLRSNELDFKDIIGISCDFLLAGMDTTSYTTSFLLYHLALNKEAQHKLWEESQRLLPNKNNPVTKEVLAEAHYAKACLKETHRLRPISVGVGRILSKPSVFSGYEVPEETIIVTQNQISCRLERYFSHPNDFLPERWLKDHPLHRNTHPFLVLPFGHGKRSCIAKHLAEQNMLILLLKLSRSYEIGWNGSNLDTTSSLINKPNGPILLNFKTRSL